MEAEFTKSIPIFTTICFLCTLWCGDAKKQFEIQKDFSDIETFAIVTVSDGRSPSAAAKKTAQKIKQII